MLKTYDNIGTRDEVPCDITSTELPDNVVWFDLLDPTPEELRFVERFIKVALPPDERLGDLQTANRLRFDGETFQVFTPVMFRDEADALRVTTVGFILGAALLVTIRTEHLRSFRDYIEHQTAAHDSRQHTPVDVFLSLLESIVDRLADGVEKVGTDLDQVSRKIFNGHTRGAKPVAYEADLEATLQVVGRAGDLTSNVRDCLLGLGRLVAFVTSNAPAQFGDGAKGRIKTLRQDITSLNDYETRLTDKVQFLLDSTLGFINIDQNRMFKLLTIASVVGIPPTFVVGLYGMNFKSMPEYDWAHGYAYGLALIALSIVVPAVWLKLKGWF